MMQLGVFLMCFGAVTIITVIVWFANQRSNSVEDMLLFAARLPIQQQETITALTISGLAFAVLGLAVSYAP